MSRSAVRKNSWEEFYTKKARQEGYPARSVYKLQEIDQKYRIFRPGDRVLDLGCAPGSWLLYIQKKVGEGRGVVGVDVVDLQIPLQKGIVFIKKDARELTKSDLDTEGKKYQVVVSDLAPATSGVSSVDAGKSLELAEKAFEIAQIVLEPGGKFVCKIFESGAVREFFKRVQQSFQLTRILRPKAVRKGSREIYVIGKGFREDN